MRFPSELEDIVIDFCHEHHSTLAACGLVCRDWLPRQPIPPVLLDIPDLQQCLKFHRHIIRLPSDSAVEVVPILLLLPQTTRLSLRPARDEVTRPVCTSSLSGALAALPLTHLKFDFKSRFESLQQVIDCACLCPQLESLEVGGSWMKTGIFAVQRQLPKGLHTLILTCDLDNILTWFLALEDRMPAIQHLSLHHIVMREVQTVVKYLETAGPTLRSLYLGFRDSMASGELGSQVDLTHSTNLRDVQLEGKRDAVFFGISALLPQLTLCGTEKVTLTIQSQGTEGLYHNFLNIPGSYAWDTLDSGFSSLKRLTLVVVEPFTSFRGKNLLEDMSKQLSLTREKLRRVEEKSTVIFSGTHSIHTTLILDNY
ncbi:hypothetical protein MVEN_00204800 [Mycena venus]|uniref:F-box domain-containing protein n=1 Tax=Mycena venus TaxID=2733690 RepID=A0A8H6Z184_9AGAR|nr:hypothetical protein MVEN_00204800 [Mycena venus]